MIRQMSRRTGLILGLLTAVLLVGSGCQESERRQQARRAEEATAAVGKTQDEIEKIKRSPSLSPESRDKQLTELYVQADRTLSQAQGQAPDYWPLKADRAEQLRRQAEHHGQTVIELMGEIRRNFSDATTTATYLTERQQSAKLEEGRRDILKFVLDKLARQRAVLADGEVRDGRTILGLKAAQAKVAELQAEAKKHREQASSLADKARAEKAKADKLIEEANSLPLGPEQGAKIAHAETFQVQAAKLQGEALAADLNAENIMNASARAALDKVSADDVVGRIAALQAVPDELAGYELAILTIQERLKALDKEEAETRQQLAQVEQMLGAKSGDSVEGLSGHITGHQNSIRTHLSRVAEAGTRLVAALKQAEEALEESANQFRAALAGLRAETSERMQESLAAGEPGQKSQFEATMELSIQMNLASAYGQLAELRRIAAEAAVLFNESGELASGVGVSGISFQTIDQAERQAAASENAKAALAVLAEALTVARVIDSGSPNQMIRDAKLTSKVVNDRREVLAALHGLPVDAQPTRQPQGPPQPPMD